jgi:hypothetical protein
MMTTGCMAACIRDFNQCVRANDAGAIFSMRTAGCVGGMRVEVEQFEVAPTDDNPAPATSAARIRLLSGAGSTDE